MKDIILFSDPSMVKGFVKQINHDEKQVYEDLDLINEKILGEEGKIFARQANQLFRDWKPIRDQVIALVANLDFQPQCDSLNHYWYCYHDDLLKSRKFANPEGTPTKGYF